MSDTTKNYHTNVNIRYKVERNVLWIRVCAGRELQTTEPIVQTQNANIFVRKAATRTIHSRTFCVYMWKEKKKEKKTREVATNRINTIGSDLISVSVAHAVFMYTNIQRTRLKRQLLYGALTRDNCALIQFDNYFDPSDIRLHKSQLLLLFVIFLRLCCKEIHKNFN